MEKICTRCNFRNPKTRSVCQVCGYSKFLAITEVQTEVIKQFPFAITSARSSALLMITELMQQTKKSAQMTLEKITTAVKRSLSKVESLHNDESAATIARDINTARTMQSKETSHIDTADIIVFNKGEDLDSLIAWFKSYGVDRPLILERKQQLSSHNSKAA